MYPKHQFTVIWALTLMKFTLINVAILLSQQPLPQSQ